MVIAGVAQAIPMESEVKTDGQKQRRTKPQPVPPTLEQFSKYHKAWQWFNAELFGGTLKPCLLTFSRHRGSFGFFAPQRWRRGK